MLLQSQLSVSGRVEMQRGRIRRGEYDVIGMLAVVVLDSEEGAQVPPTEFARLGRRITFLTGNAVDRKQRTPVALSKDQREILLPFGLPDELPKIPEPSWEGRRSVKEETPWIEQYYEERSSGRTLFLDRTWLIFQPVCQLLMLGVGYFKQTAWPKLMIQSDFNGDHMALLLDRESGQAHFIGGRFEPLLREPVSREILRPSFDGLRMT